MPQNKVSQPKRKIKMQGKNPLKTHLLKKLQKWICFCSVFLKLSKPDMFFQKQEFYFLDESNKQT